MTRIATFAALALAASVVHAQAFPERPVRVITPFAAGNTLETALRIVGDEIKRQTGQPLVIESRPGGSGLIAAQAVAQAAPDGYTLLLGNTSMLTVNPHTFKSLPYDPEKSFRPITNFLGSAMVMAANLGAPGATLQEFIAYAKANPGKTNFASFTAGNSSHFAGVILNQRAGIDMLHVPFNGTPPAVQNLLGGQVQTAFLPLLAVKPHVESGKVRVYAATSPQRSPLLPNVPTFRELGYPELDIYIWASIMAPAGTPEPIVQKLNAEFVRALKSDEVRTRWRALDFEPLPSTPAEFTEFMRAESKRWGDAVRLSGFKASE
jgi:tripartite-type tricarboxylate transporter receptor subunit TctC